MKSQDVKVDFVSFGNPATTMNVRILSGGLKKKGHETRVFYLPDPCPSYTEPQEKGSVDIDQVVRTMVERTASSDIICVSASTSTFPMAERILSAIGKDGPFRIIGGPHPSQSMESCFGSVDAVCVGEGDLSLSRFVDAFEQGSRYPEVPGFFYRINDRIRGLPPLLINDLDVLEMPDYDPLTQYVYTDGGFERLSIQHLDINHELKGYICVISMRGCTYQCSFCHISAKAQLLGTKGIRKITINKLLEELANIKQHFPEIEGISFYDNMFFLRSTEEIREFARRFKKEIGLRFMCQTAPSTITEEKLKILIEAGLDRVHVGVQSGSERVNFEIYGRPLPNALTIRAMDILKKYANKIKVTYSFITNNPYENAQDIQATIQLLQNIPSPAEILLYSLALTPGTFLSMRADQDGILPSLEENRDVSMMSSLPQKSELWVTEEHMLSEDRRRDAYRWIMHGMRGAVRRHRVGSLPRMVITPLLMIARSPASTLVTHLLKFWTSLHHRLFQLIKSLEKEAQ